MKICTKCGQSKSPDEFHRNAARPDGRAGRCKTCLNAIRREYNAANKDRISVQRKAQRTANKEKIAAQKRAYHAANRETIAARKAIYYAANRDRINAANRARRAQNPEKYRARDRARYQEKRAKSLEAFRRQKYGLEPLAYQAMLDAHDGCAVCGGATARGLFVDHCHDTGRVRGLLCQNCNTGLGMFGDNRELLLAAIEYLDSGVDWRPREGKS